MRLKLIQESIVFNPNGNTTGIVYFEFDNGDFFPDNRWNDFIDVLLNWWVSALLNLIEHEQDSVELLFMDGPYRIELIQAASNECFEIKLKRNKTLLNYFDNPKLEFVESFYQSINKHLRFYNSLGFMNKEVESLIKKFSSLQDAKRLLKGRK